MSHTKYICSGPSRAFLLTKHQFFVPLRRHSTQSSALIGIQIQDTSPSSSRGLVRKSHLKKMLKTDGRKMSKKAHLEHTSEELKSKQTMQ